MADAPTQTDLFLVGAAEATTLPTRFDTRIVETEGSDVNTILNVCAAMGEEVVRYLQVALNELALGTAEGEALDRFVFDRYQLRRKEASAAVATLRLSRTGTVGFTVQAGSQFGTDTGVVFESLVDVAFPANELGPFDVLASAVVAGPSGRVGAGKVSQVLTGTADPTLTVTNPEPASGGSERETADQFRARARDFFVTARRGTRTAIEFGGREVSGVAQSTAIEVLQVSGIPGYRVQLNVADESGQANTALANEVQRSLDDYRALGVPVLVVPAIPQYVDIEFKGLKFKAGSNTQLVLQQLANALLSLVNTLQPRATLRVSELLAVAVGIDQLIVPEGALVQPAGDLVPSTGTVVRTTRDRIKFTP
jgi:uncharacterized phage protein gp47/JayE